MSSSAPTDVWVGSPAPGRSRPSRRLVIAVLAVVAAIVVAFAVVRSRRQPAAPPYLTAPVTRGDIVETVEATGTLQPLLQVQVGSQVSGRIRALFVDFNSRVRSGQLLAEIEPAPFRAAVEQQQAAVLSAEAQVLRARTELTLQRRNAERVQALRTRGLNAPADLDAAVAARDAAQAQVGVAQAQVSQTRAALRLAQTNLEYTRIFAPMDGVVITRAVDVGQTVAASFQAPVLFVIGNDLTRMQVVANVDEADVGRLREGMQVDARVDAFPAETFRGQVKEVRYGSTTVQGVVTYPAVIDVPNPDLKLRPGMTATISVVTARAQGVLRVPNAALRFRPPARGGGPGAAGESGGPVAARSGVRGGTGRIYLLEDRTARPITVDTGISDGAFTEVRGPGLRDGVRVVTDVTDDPSERGAGRPERSPGGGGGPRRLL